MSSKAARRRKRKGKGGRPRLPGIERQPNGRPSQKPQARRQRQEMTAAEAKAVVLDARRRHTGLPDALLDLGASPDLPNAGTVHGVMALEGSLTADQWRAAEWYLGLRIAYLRAIDAPGRSIDPVEPAGAGDEAAFAHWCRATIERWTDVLALLAETGREQRCNPKSAFDEILVYQQREPHLEGDLRIGLNAIHRRFLAGRRAAA